jgi:hypothetical protein
MIPGGDTQIGPDAAQKEALLQEIRKRFVSRKFIAEIVVIPDYYLQGRRGFEGLQGDTSDLRPNALDAGGSLNFRIPGDQAHFPSSALSKSRRARLPKRLILPSIAQMSACVSVTARGVSSELMHSLPTSSSTHQGG